MPINGVVENKLRFLEQVLADLESWPLGDPAQCARNSMRYLGSIWGHHTEFKTQISKVSPEFIVNSRPRLVRCHRNSIDCGNYAYGDPKRAPLGDPGC